MINAVRDADDVVNGSTNANKDVGVDSSPARPNVSVPEDLHAAINAALQSEHCRNIVMIGYHREIREVRRELRSRMDILNESHRNITQNL
jgi:hypothetical protein